MFIQTYVLANTQVKILGSSNGESPLQLLVEEFNQTEGLNEGVTLLLESEPQKVSQALNQGLTDEADLVLLPDAENIGPFIHKKTVSDLNLRELLGTSVPSHLIGEKYAYVMLTKRARIIYFNKQFVQQNQVSTYEDLGKNKFQGKVCLRNSSKTYNTTLVSDFIQNLGTVKTQQILKSWIFNQPVIKQKDTDVLRAVDSGECYLGLANTYYLASYLKENPASDLGFIFPNQEDMGTHINGKFLILTKSGERNLAAKKVLIWLMSKNAQEFFTAGTNEFPVSQNAALNSFQKKFGSFVENAKTDYSLIYDLKPVTQKLILNADWK